MSNTLPAFFCCVPADCEGLLLHSKSKLVFTMRPMSRYGLLMTQESKALLQGPLEVSGFSTSHAQLVLNHAHLHAIVWSAHASAPHKGLADLLQERGLISYGTQMQ
jgi:hypothetical protein